MHCPACGAQLEETAAFCPHCGTPTSSPSVPTHPTDGTDAAERFDLEASALGLFFRILGAGIALLYVIPAPWIACWISGWFVSRIRLNGRPRLVFRGTPGGVAVLALLYALVIVVGAISGADDDLTSVQAMASLASIPLTWAYLRWVINHSQLDGRPLRFDGSLWVYLGWTLLAYASIVTIVGWAWVLAAFYRWIAGQVQDAGGELRFVAKGHEVLWRTIVYILFCIPIVTIPWALRWFLGWIVQQFELDRQRADRPIEAT